MSAALLAKKLLTGYQYIRPNCKLLLTCFLLLIMSCNSKTGQKKYRIGFSQCLGTDDWRKTMLAEMKRELAFHNDIEFVYRHAQANSATQVSQIRELLGKKIDLLIVSPNEVKPLTPIIEEVYDAGIPVVVVDRRIDSKKYTAFIGASNYELGQNAGTYAVSLLKGKGKVIEIAGLPAGASPPIDRHKGFMDVIKEYPDIKYMGQFDDSTKEGSFLKKNPDIDLIYAQNDVMALEAYNICKKLGIQDRIRIIGIDGLATKNGGLDLVHNGQIVATVLYPTGGQESILTAVNILKKKPFEKDNQLLTSIIDSTNIRITKLQNEKMLAQQKDIDRRQQKIEAQEIVARNQSRIIFIVSVSLGLSLILGSVLYFSLRENKKINKRLALQNKEIIRQQDQLIELGKKAKEATDAKFNFFTNISHELRTPLTLILGPLEDVMSITKLPLNAKRQLELVKKNAMRLLRLVNQLMDFRKIEGAKMKMRVTENNITAFVTEIANAFSEMARKKNITYRITSGDHGLMAWFDVNMLDKILFNILSNALKYTGDHGFIKVFIDKQKDNVVIKIEDSGIGMETETLNHAFDLFYQGHEGAYKGTGLGLALSKELITMHHGTITIQSEKWKGATFEISFPLGKDHFEPSELADENEEYEINYEEAKIYVNACEHTLRAIPDEPIFANKDKSVLIIEDNPDIRAFIKSQLSKQYEVIEAENGNTGLNYAFEIIPDIVISDLLLPGKDGMAITEKLKNDIRTSHIPIILLTAKGTIEQQIEGLRSNADAYIVKPFSSKYLEETIRSLLNNREFLKEHYTTELQPDHNRNAASKKIDRKFINEFSAIVESNIDNEDFCVADICTAMGISKVQLYRKVKAVLGYNVNEYILNARMQKAKYLLMNEELTISQVSYKVGFSSQTYFTTVFKSKFGLTPKAFKENGSHNT